MKLIFQLLSLLIFIIQFSVVFASADVKGDGRLVLYSYHNGDVVEVTYKTPNGYDKEALKQINQVMRSPDGIIIKIPIKLIELIDNIQDHFGAETVEIISGYRSPSYNGSLRRNGHGVAAESLHTKGMAADIHVDEITEDALARYVLSLEQGGVGYYPASNFVHIDIGPIRTWGEKVPKERAFIGAENNPNKAWKLTTDKNEYSRGEPVKTTITNVAYEQMSLTKNIWYEMFRKGRWKEHELITKKKGSRTLKPGKSIKFEWEPKDLPFGKYRLVVFTDKDFSIPPVFSNEFYLKKE